MGHSGFASIRVRTARLRVGLAWSGNARAFQRPQPLPCRSPLLRPLLDADAVFVSLQQNRGPATAARWSESGIIDLTAHLTDFAETVALVSCLDLVIRCGHGVADLAGAPGRPTWILLPYTPDWRWLLGRDDSPWYPTARLFRQSAARSWDEIAYNVRRALEEFVTFAWQGWVKPSRVLASLTSISDNDGNDPDQQLTFVATSIQGSSREMKALYTAQFPVERLTPLHPFT